MLIIQLDNQILTMVGQKHSPITLDTSYLRKVRKPLIEKKRRDRMNSSIDRLNTLLGQSLNNANMSTAKLDKADILDLTVSHLARLQDQQASITMATHVASYKAGFKDSTTETIRYLTSARMICPESMCSLNGHLQNVYINTVAKQQTTNAVLSIATQKHTQRYTSSPIDNSGYGKLITLETPTRVQSFGNVDNSGSYSPNSTSGSVDCDMYSSCDVILGNIIEEETPWRPW